MTLKRCLTTILLGLMLSGCSVTADYCAWESYSQRSAGWLGRWTHEEKVWAEAHDQKLDKFCRSK